MNPIQQATQQVVEATLLLEQAKKELEKAKEPDHETVIRRLLGDGPSGVGKISKIGKDIKIELISDGQAIYGFESLISLSTKGYTFAGLRQRDTTKIIELFVRYNQ